MTEFCLPEDIQRLHAEEEELRQKATKIVVNDERSILHLVAIERAMDMAYLLHLFPTENEDLKLIQVLGMQLFNAFAASVKLSLSGYGQNSTLIMRNILETTFLLNLFGSDRGEIKRWRLADKKEQMKSFSPARVREAIDARDGFTSRKRALHYQVLSELAGHPSMKSVLMMRPQKDGDAVIGPFVEEGPFNAVFSEIGKLAVLAGGALDCFFPDSWSEADEVRKAFAQIQQTWLETFYPPRPETPEPNTG